MSVTVHGSGTQTATIGVEHVLDTTTVAGTYVFIVNLTNLVGGDTVELRVNGKVLAGDTPVADLMDAYTGVQTEGNVIARSIPIVTDLPIDVTIKQTAGTGRSFAWKLLQL